MAGHIHTAKYWVPEDKMGRPKKTWQNTLKESLKEMGVSWHVAMRDGDFLSERRGSAVVSTLAYHAASPGSIPGPGCEHY